jgi:hypothetical protein
MHARGLLTVQGCGMAMASGLDAAALGVGGDSELQFTAACGGGLLQAHTKG